MPDDFDIAANDKGDKLIHLGGEWQKVDKTAANDKGQRSYQVGGMWYTEPPDYAAVSRMGSAERFARGAGHQVAEWGRGAAQILSGLPQVQGESVAFDAPDDPKERAERQRYWQQNEAQSREQNRALMGTTAGQVGAFAAETAPFLAAPEGAVAAAGVGALEGLLTPTQGDESRAWNVGTGAAGAYAGTKVARGVARVVQPISKLTPAYQRGVEWLRQQGIPLDAYQQAGGAFLRTIKNVVEDHPIFGPTRLRLTQVQKYTQAMLAYMGVNANEATTNTLAQGVKNLQDTYNAIEARTQLRLDPVMDRALQAIKADARKNLIDAHFNTINGLIDDMYNAVRYGPNYSAGDVEGPAFLNIKQRLGEIGGEGGKAPLLKRLKEEWFGAFQRSASAADQALLRATDAKWAAWKQIARGVVQNDYISPAQLYSTMDTVAREGQSLLGKGPNPEMMKGAQAGKNVLGTLDPNSGTARRLIGLGLLSGAMGAGGEEADRRYRGGGTFGWEPGLVAAATGLFGPVALRAAMENPKVAAALRYWMTNQGGVRAGAANVIRRGGGPAAAAAASTTEGQGFLSDMTDALSE